MRTLVLGIDPGLDGATVLIDRAGKNLSFFPHYKLAKMGKYIDPRSYIENINRLIEPESIDAAFGKGPKDIYSYVMIEEAPVLSGQAGQRVVGVNWGVVMTCWLLSGYNILSVAPNMWKKKMVGGPKSPLVQQHGKRSSCVVAENMGYVVPIHRPASTKKHDGVADATLIAEYGIQKILEDHAKGAVSHAKEGD